MPLPTENTNWPPEPYNDAQNAMAVWAAWYDGDENKLTELYTQERHVRPAQWRGGLVGRVARFFWGRPNPQAAKRVHVPAAADLARASSDLLFSEPPKFGFPAPDGDEDLPEDVADAQERLDKIFNNDGVSIILAEAGELASALGGVYFRLWWDEDIADHVMMARHPADAAIPEWKYDRLQAVTFWRVVDTGKKQIGGDAKVLRHLERHEKGRIYHGLYRGTDTKLGQPIPLDQHKSTAWAADLVDETGGIDTGVDQLTACYVPNVLPNRQWRTVPELSQLGRSDFDGVEGLFDALDETMSSWMRDVELGKARLFVDENMLHDLGPGKGGQWDSDQAIFTPLSSGLGSSLDGNNPITQTQFAIRWSEHSQTAAELLNAILRNAGLSASQFSDTALTIGVPTATEVNARNEMAERTRNKKVNYFKASLTPLVKTALELDDLIFNTGATVDVDPVITFPVRSLQSPGEKTTVLAQQRTASLVSIYEGLVQLHPNWTPPEIEEELARIKNDQLEQMKLAFGQAGAETPAEDTEGQPDDGAAAELADMDDQQMQNMAQQLAEDNAEE